jgi:hypothetical protein
MSIHNLPPDVAVGVLTEELVRQGRPASLVKWNGTNVVVTFDVDLTPAEANRLSQIASWLRSGLRITFDEYLVVRPDLDLLAAFIGVATPTAAQTAAALKAHIRVHRAILRD